MWYAFPHFLTHQILEMREILAHRMTVKHSDSVTQQFDSELHTREMKTDNHMKTWARMSTAAPLILASKYKQPKCRSVDEHMNRT